MRLLVLLLLFASTAHAAYPTDPVLFCPLDELTAGGAKDLVSGQIMTYHGADTAELAGDRTWKKLTGINGVEIPATMLEGDRPSGFWRQAHTVMWWQYGPSADETGTIAVVGNPNLYQPFLAPMAGDFWFDDRYVRGFQVALWRQANFAAPWGQLVPEFNAQTLNASWSLVSLRFDPATMQMQVGKGTTEWSYTFAATDLWGSTDAGKGRFLLGSDGTFTGGGTRLVGSLAIFNRVLSDSEVAEIHSLGPGFVPDYWGGGGEDPGGEGPSDPGLALLLTEMERAADFLDTLKDTGDVLREWLKLLVTFILFGLGVFLFRLLTIARDRKKILGALVAVGLGGATAQAQNPPPCTVWERAAGPLNDTFVPQAGPWQATCLSASHSMMTMEETCTICQSGGFGANAKVHKVVFLVKMHPTDNGANTENDWILKTVWLTVAQLGPVPSSTEKRHYARLANANPGSTWREMNFGWWDRCGTGKYCIYKSCADLYDCSGPFWPEGTSINDLYKRLYEGWQDPCGPLTKDTDGDGIPDKDDPDDDNDGVPDVDDEDDDGDGVPDWKDPDRDDDNDGIMNPDDKDDDNDGVPDDNDPDDDDDNDGIPNPQDPDDDNDGKPDGQDPDHPDGPDDGDGDGIPDAQDPDDDDDGVPDANDPDDDNDGIPDDEEPDDDDDDEEEPEEDTDNDGIPDDTDLDDDNDGCLDPQDPSPKSAGTECNNEGPENPDDDTIPGEDWQPGDRETFWHISCESNSPWTIIRQGFMTRLVGNLDESGWRDFEAWTEGTGQGFRFPYLSPSNMVQGNWAVEYITLTPTGEVTVPGRDPWQLTGWNQFADGVYTVLSAALVLQFVFKAITAIAGGA